MIVKTYKARVGSAISDKDAAVIGTYLEEKFNGHVFTTEEVLDAATPKRSPIHKYFTWDRAAAARNWNLQEARQLVNSVMLVEHSGSDDPVTTRAFHHVVELQEDGARSGYVVERVAWERTDFAEQIIERAKREFMAWKERHAQYEELFAWAMTELQEAA